MEIDIRTRKTIAHDSANFAVKELYFITICVERKNCLLGKIKNHDIEISNLGESIIKIIENTNKKYKEDIISEYVVMPNHIHMIINMSLLDFMQYDTEKSPSIATIIRDFKSFSTRIFNANQTEVLLSLWQRGYYDHRIRNTKEFETISEYIKENPKRWATDKFYLE